MENKWILKLFRSLLSCKDDNNRILSVFLNKSFILLTAFVTSVVMKQKHSCGMQKLKTAATS